MKRLSLVCIHYAGMNFEGYRGWVLRQRAGSPLTFGSPALEKGLEGGKITAKEANLYLSNEISRVIAQIDQTAETDRKLELYHPQGEGVSPGVECAAKEGSMV